MHRSTGAVCSFAQCFLGQNVPIFPVFALMPRIIFPIIQIASDLVDAGAGGVVAGCTEIGLLIHADDLPVPFLDTTRLHATAAVDRALEEPT